MGFAHALLRALLRRTWLFTAITVAICAGFAARAAAALIEAGYLAPVRVEAPRRAAPQPPPAPPRVAPDDDQLVRRNMFCSSCSPGEPGAAPVAEIALAGAELIATEIADEARATVRVLASDVQGSWGVGDAIPGLGQLAQIAPTWVAIVDGAGHRGRLSLRDLAGRAPGPETVPAPPSSPACDALADRIRALDDRTYVVDRALVRELVGGGARPGQPRLIPLFENGQVLGVRLLGVTPCSVPALLGLKNGDRLTAIDGVSLQNAQQVLDLYARLDALEVVEVSGTRAGQPLVRALRLR